MPSSQENRWWSIFSAVAAILGFGLNVVAIVEIWQGAEPSQLWWLALVFSLALWAGAWRIRRDKGRRSIMEYDGPRPVYREEPRYPRIVRVLALIILWGIPLMLVGAAAGYAVWRLVPPTRTVVLVADLVDGEGRDSRLLTDTLVKEMRKVLAEHDSIVIRRLNRSITGEKGAAHARRIARHPSYKAAYVIWGQYTVAGDEPKLHVYFELLRDVYPLGQRLDLVYGPQEVFQGTEIARPTLFDFEVALGRHMSHLTAFAAAMALYENGNHRAAEPLFDTACLAVETPLGVEMARALRLNRGTNYLRLGRAAEAEPDLRPLVPVLDTPVEAWDEFALAALGNLGLVAMNQGDYAVARDYLQRALDLHTQLGNPRGQAASLNNLGVVAGHQGDYAVARDYHQRALALYAQLGYSCGQARVLNNLGLVAMEQGDYAAARDYLQRALDLASQLGNPWGQAASLGNLGAMAGHQGDYVAARDYHRRTLDLYTQLGNPLGQAGALNNLGLVAMEQGDSAAARDYLQQSLDLYTQLGNPLGQAKVLGNLGVLARNQGDHAAARDYHQCVLDLYTQLGNPLGQAASLGNLGGVAMDQGDYAAARDYCQRALDLYTQLDNPRGQAGVLNNLGLVAMEQGDYAAARDYLQRSIDLDTRLGDLSGQAAALNNLGLVAMDQGDYAATRDYYQRALDLHIKLDHPLGQAIGFGNLGLLAEREGQYHEACDLLSRSVALYRDMGLPVPGSFTAALARLGCTEN